MLRGSFAVLGPTYTFRLAPLVLVLLFLPCVVSSAQAQDRAKSMAAFDLAPEFVRDCMKTSLDAELMKQSMLKFGATALPDESQPNHMGATTTFGFAIRYADHTAFMKFDARGLCTIFAQDVDFDATKASLEKFIASASGAYDIERVPEGVTDHGGRLMRFLLHDKAKVVDLRFSLYTSSKSDANPITYLARVPIPLSTPSSPASSASSDSH